MIIVGLIAAFILSVNLPVVAAAVESTSISGGVVAPAVIPNDEMLKMRDPFKRPEIEIAKSAPKTPLESFSVDNFKMIGVLTGPERLRALLKDPESKTHIVSESMRIGTRNGVILKISEEAIFVREKIVNVLGQEENVDSTISLQQKVGK